jgi:hypothetical protein
MKVTAIQPTETNIYVNQFLSSEQSKLLVSYISKDVKWDKEDGVKSKTYSKYPKFGSISQVQEFPLWANMVAKKLYYEKMVDFFPSEVIVIEQDYNSKTELGSIINNITNASEKSAMIILETFSDMGKSSIQPGTLMLSNYIIENKRTPRRQGKMMAILFKKN